MVCILSLTDLVVTEDSLGLSPGGCQKYPQFFRENISVIMYPVLQNNDKYLYPELGLDILINCFFYDSLKFQA